jgi:hypothetical protein
LKENINIIEAIEGVFHGLEELRDLSTWKDWMVCLKSIFGLSLDNKEFRIYKKFTERSRRPRGPFREFWGIVGRRGGKSFIAALILVFLAVFRRWERPRDGFLISVAVDRRQASVILRYVKRILRLPAFKGMVVKEMAEEIQLKNGLTIGVFTCSYRSLRGFNILATVCDEISFWSHEGADPSNEILNAIRPSLRLHSDSLLIAISSAFAKFGPVWEVFSESFGENDPGRLVWRGGTLDMNPTYDREFVAKEMLKDPARARSEYLSEFRADIETYLSAEIIESAILPNRFELPPQKDINYVAFADPSGGSRDSFTLAIAHKTKNDRIILDCLRETRPPFSPVTVVSEFAEILRSYRCSIVTGDRYSAEWVVEAFRDNGITYKSAEQTKSELYLNFIPLMMGRRVELLDNRRMILQLRQLERRTGSGADRVDHPSGGHDDCINSAAAACVQAAQADRSKSYHSVAERSMLG